MSGRIWDPFALEECELKKLDVSDLEILFFIFFKEKVHS